MAPKKQYWLVKSEPDAFSFDDLLASKDRTTMWDGVRNYQARNFMRDAMRVGDGVLFYHSNTKPPGVAGVCEVASEAYPDPTQFDPEDPHFDPKSKREDPRWWLVDLRAVRPLEHFVPLARLREAPELEGMAILQRGNRLSVTPVTPSEWRAVLKLGTTPG